MVYGLQSVVYQGLHVRVLRFMVYDARTKVYVCEFYGLWFMKLVPRFTCASSMVYGL